MMEQLVNNNLSNFYFNKQKRKYKILLMQLIIFKNKQEKIITKMIEIFFKKITNKKTKTKSNKAKKQEY